ncbi:BEACH domain-containing protein lvsF-like isoform X1 [Centruroides sculpturatus]|uniref:BEACH domain-containing protein lvsF-like isoform X1 n=2 Tax=Centruroides sculpturatus TaxID=218467 RepID=UPI000C6E6EF6|nr:BEACH domain-containing protein lvsF-like isoform X1 [Centruroides sculpturatus]
MAYVDGHRKERFSLLLLEPSEIYFEDYSVFSYPANFPEEEAIKRKQKGRLKVCSKSLVFEPNDINKPILKFQLNECTIIDQWNGSLLSKLDTKGNVIRVVSEQVVEIEGGVIAPYRFKRERQAYLFTLNYVSASHCLPQILQLRRAATLPGVEQASMIAAIVMSRQSRVSFDTSWLEDLYETIILETTGNRITPLVTNPGRILLTSSRIYFQPYNNAEPWPVLKIRLSDIKRAVKRRFLLRHVGIELYCSNNSPIKHLFLTLKSHEERENLYSKLLEQPALDLEDTATDSMTLLWQNGMISNYDYLLYLNSMADRSFNDLTQYPIFPWVISNYTSSTLDISDPSSYRDLSKPIGALNEDRLQKLMERYEEMADPKFMYGSHYSTPGFVLYYLVRQMPQYMLCLQNGKFDHPDRMFNSIPDTWRNVTTNTSDFKELTPQFYEPENKGEFLVNSQNLEFGFRQDGTKVKDVELPKWAKDPQDFIIKLRSALESDIVSENIHHWIDLMFGYKQQGEEAVKAKNVFYYLTYEGAIDLDSIKDINERYSLEVQIMEFGQTPKQIFTHPHPERKLPRIMQDRLWSQNCYVEAKDGIQSEQASGGTLVNRHRKLSLEQRVFLLQNWWKCDKKYATVKKMFIEKYPAAEPPTRQAIYKLNKRFEETGAVVDLPRSGRPRTAVTDDNVRKVAEAFLANPGKSIRKASAEFGIARSSYQRILDKL